MREAAAISDRWGLDLSPAAIRVMVNRYQSSGDADTYTLSRWLEVRGFNPTEATALERVTHAEARVGGGRHG